MSCWFYVYSEFIPGKPGLKIYIEVVKIPIHDNLKCELLNIAKESMSRCNLCSRSKWNLKSSRFPMKQNYQHYPDLSVVWSLIWKHKIMSKFSYKSEYFDWLFPPKRILLHMILKGSPLNIFCFYILTFFRPF